MFQGNQINLTNFILIIELLAIKMKNNLRIEDIRIGFFTTFLTMVADDLNIFVLNKENVCKAIKDTIAELEQISGLKVNYEKSTACRLGSARFSQAKSYVLSKVQSTNEPIKILGVVVTDQKKQMILIIGVNINQIFDKAQITRDLWGQRDLSLKGKALIFNSLVGSPFLYYRPQTKFGAR